jgi:hypothetical protein
MRVLKMRIIRWAGGQHHSRPLCVTPFHLGKYFEFRVVEFKSGDRLTPEFDVMTADTSRVLANHKRGVTPMFSMASNTRWRRPLLTERSGKRMWNYALIALHTLCIRNSFEPISMRGITLLAQHLMRGGQLP